MAGIDDLLAFERALGDLGESYGTQAASIAATAIGKTAKAQFSAGTDPYGSAWAPTKDGRRAFPKAAREIEFSAQGSDVVESAPEQYKFHQNPSHGPARKVYPDPGSLPPAWEKAAHDEILIDAFKRFRRFL